MTVPRDNGHPTPHVHDDEHTHDSSDEHVHDHDHGDEHTHDHNHGDEHPHDHDHGDSEHSHAQARGLFGWLTSYLNLHTHDHHDLAGDSLLSTSKQGIRALQISLLSLFLTAVMQVVIVAISGSVALLADTIHNFADASTAIPLWIAFALNRRKPGRGFTYRYGKAEDLAGAFVVLVIAVSALVVFYETWQKIVNPQPIRNLGWVAVAAIVGFLGNEAAALVRIRTGRSIGSAALIADGMHARVDGLTSLGVLLGAIGVWLGFPLADPLVGLLIGVAILFIIRDAANTMWQRLMDAVDPTLVDTLEETASDVQGVHGVHKARLRWVGHALWGEVHVEVDGDLATTESHQIAEEVRHALYHALPRLSDVTVHVDPRPTAYPDPYHLTTAHHAESEAA